VSLDIGSLPTKFYAREVVMREVVDMQDKKYIYISKKMTMVWLDKAFIPRLGSCRAFEAAVKLQFRPLITVEVHYVKKNTVMFSWKTFISFQLKKQKH